MPQSGSSQKQTSPSATPVPSDKATGEGLWMKGNIKLDHKQSPFRENTSTSPHDGQRVPSKAQSSTMACDIAGNDHVSIIPWTDCCPDDPDKARELATSTGVPGILVYPANIFSHASDSQVNDAVDASQKSDEPRADMETQTSPRGVADAEIESQTTVRTPHLTGEPSKIRQGGIGTMGGSEKLLPGSAPETQNPRPGDIKIYAHTVNASNKPEVLGSGEISQYFNPTNFPVNWGAEEGIDINSLLGDIANVDKMELPEAYAPSDRDDVSRDNANRTVCGPGSCKFGQLFVYQIDTSANDLFDQTKDCGGMDANHGLPPWTKNSSGVTGGPSAKDTTYSTEERLSTSSVQLSGLRPTPSPRGDLNLSHPVSLSAVGHTVTTGDFSPSGAKPDIQVELVTGAEKPRHESKTQDAAGNWDTDIDFSLDDGARKMTNEDLITLGLQDGLPGRLSDASTGLPPMTEEYWRELETEQNVRLFACDGTSEVDTGRVMAKNNRPADIGPLRSVGAPVSKFCTPSSATPDIQVELAGETEKSRDDSEAKEAAEICGTDVDFDLNCGARKITEEDFVTLGLHDLWWAKLSDATTGPPPMSTEDLRVLENASKDSPFLGGGANARDGSEENVTANKTGIHIGDSKLSVANANSLRSMEFVPPIDISGSQDSSGDALPGSSPKWQLPKADDVPQTIDSAKTPNVTNSDRADESVWVKVEMATDNLPTQTDTVEVE